jgi:hypothetical protein
MHLYPSRWKPRVHTIVPYRLFRPTSPTSPCPPYLFPARTRRQALSIPFLPIISASPHSRGTSVPPRARYSFPPQPRPPRPRSLWPLWTTHNRQRGHRAARFGSARLGDTPSGVGRWTFVIRPGCVAVTCSAHSSRTCMNSCTHTSWRVCLQSMSGSFVPCGRPASRRVCPPGPPHPMAFGAWIVCWDTPSFMRSFRGRVRVSGP